MADSVVREWIAEYKSLRSAEIPSFGYTILQNNELIQAIFTVLEEKRYHEELLEPVCHQFFSFYQSREENLQNFARQYIPPLVQLYLSSTAKGNKKNVRCVEVILKGIYNLEVFEMSGKTSCQNFRIPLLSKPSIYHEPMSLSHTILSERALSTLEYSQDRTITIGPYKEVEKINASNRLLVTSVLMWLYNRHIGNMSTFSHMSVCKMSSRIVKQGFNRTASTTSYNNPLPRPIPRIPLSSSLLLELIHAVYFATFNGFGTLGYQTLDELHNRALQEMLSDVILVTNAIRNSNKSSLSGQASDGPMGISVALSPTTVVSTVSRAITNASFRAKKLPDDIPIIQQGDADAHLSSINEESEEAATDAQPTPHAKHSSGSKKHSSNGKSVVLQLKKGAKTKKDNSIPEDATDSTEPDFEIRLPSSTNGAGGATNRNSYSGAGGEVETEAVRFINHSKSEVVLTTEGVVLKSVLHRSESSNGVTTQNSMQTAV